MSQKYLIHYASPYYDPVKAHEYYIKNRELKGRTSTASLNDKGKEVASYVKQKLTAERKQKVESHKKKTDSLINSSKNKKNKDLDTKRTERDTEKESLRNEKKQIIESHKASMNNAIDNLKAALKSMSKADRAANKEAYQQQINNLRKQNSEARARITAEYSAMSKDVSDQYSKYSKQRSEQHRSYTKNARTTHTNERKRLKTEYDNKYVNELNRIKSESAYLKPKKR